MCQKKVKECKLVQATFQRDMRFGTRRWRTTLGGTNIPELWSMAALMKMCPMEINHNIELSWDTIDEKYTVRREKVVMWATHAEEKGVG